MTTTVKLNCEKIEKAWNNWIDFHFGVDCDETTTRFCCFVDVGDINPTPVSPWDANHDCDDNGDIEALPEIVEKINMLAGPNFHTIIHVYYAQHPWK